MSNQAVAEAAGEITEQVVETTLDVVEAAPTAVITVAKNNPWVLAGVAVASAAAGAGVALYFGNRHYKALYEKMAAEDVAEAREHYSKKFKDGDFANPVDLAKKYEDLDEVDASDDIVDEVEAVRQTELITEAIDILKEQEYIPYNQLPSNQSKKEAEVAKASIKHNVFKTPGAPREEPEEYDLDVEYEKRDQGLPYIVEQDRYLENEDGFTQATLAWYEEDGTLADEDDTILSDQINDLIGGEGNLKFGCGTTDANIVYIYNEECAGGTGFEIIRDRGSYSKAVLGIDPNVLEETDRRRQGTRKMRPDD